VSLVCHTQDGQNPNIKLYVFMNFSLSLILCYFKVVILVDRIRLWLYITSPTSCVSREPRSNCSCNLNVPYGGASCNGSCSYYTPRDTSRDTPCNTYISLFLGYFFMLGCMTQFYKPKLKSSFFPFKAQLLNPTHPIA